MFTIEAEVRNVQGKGASRRLRTANKFPAIVYGGEAAPVAIELDHDKLWNLQTKAEFYSEVLTIVVGGKEEKVKVQAVQRHAFQAKTDSHRLRSRVIANSSKKTPLLRGFFMALISRPRCGAEADRAGSAGVPLMVSVSVAGSQKIRSPSSIASS
ncbi:hypothetical protein L1887_46367 [Cichorium endivia]|nr:hypothetical protein L1887_46367 [Cichorium endivia]